ncbi:MAG: hypothetical protein RJB39_726 [Candidatus Parcubacteria bacterium]|jgi:hypothetical protein
MRNLKITSKLFKYLLPQRTQYANWTLLSKVLHKIETRGFYKISYALKSWFLPRAIRNDFNYDMFCEFLMIKHFLPAQCTNMLDIGSGLSAYNVYVSEYYKNQVHLYLLDKTQIDRKTHFYFQDTASFYNSLIEAKLLLVDNGVPEKNISTMEVTGSNDIPNQKFDLVLSLLAWGHHFPVSTYIDKVYSNMNDGAVLILDVRKNTDGEETLRKYFKNFVVIQEDKRSHRYCLVKGM